MNARTRLLAGAAALAAATTIAPGTAAASHRQTPAPGHHAAGFAPITALDFDALRIASAAPGRAVVAGVRRADATGEGPLVVATAVGRRWTTTTLAATATDVRIAASDGRTVVLGVGDRPSLWQHDGHRWTRLPLPTTVETARSVALASAHGTPVIVGSVTADATPADTHPSQVLMVTRYLDGAWQGRAAVFGPSILAGSVMAPYVAVAVQGHVLTPTTHFRPTHGIVHDVSTTPMTPLVRAEGRDPLHDDVFGGMTALSPRDVIVWGARTTWGVASSRWAGRGLCLRSPSSEECPAPQWAVSAATQLKDGRSVLGGKDTDAEKVDGQVTRRVEGGFACAAPGATPTPVAGDPGDTTLSIAAEPTGTTVWALTRTGDLRQVQKATLPAIGTRR